MKLFVVVVVESRTEAMDRDECVCGREKALAIESRATRTGSTLGGHN